MKKIVALGGVGAFLAFVLAGVAWSDEVRDTYTDETFVRTAIQAGLTEVKLGKIAEDRGSSERVRIFGQEMIVDHTKTTAELRGIAKGKDRSIPGDPSDEQEKVIERLEKLEGIEFDREYAKVMVDEHKKAVSLFEDEAKNGRDEDFKAFAKRTLPVFKHHLGMAEGLAAGIPVSPAPK